MRKSNRKLKNYLLITILATSASPAFAAGGFTLMYGQKNLDADTWPEVESQQEAGFSIEYQGADWPVTVIASYLISEAAAIGTAPGITAKIRGNTTEIGLGIRKYLSKNLVRPFVEAGLISVKGELSVSLDIPGYFSGTVSANDTGTGYWIGAGINSMLSDSLGVGVLGRLSSADMSLDGLNTDAGGKHVIFTITQYLD